MRPPDWEARADALLARIRGRGGMSVSDAMTWVGPITAGRWWVRIWRRCVAQGAEVVCGVIVVDDADYDPLREHDHEDCAEYDACLDVAARADAGHVCAPGCHRYVRCHILPSTPLLTSSMGQIDTLPHEPRIEGDPRSLRRSRLARMRETSRRHYEAYRLRDR